MLTLVLCSSVIKIRRSWKLLWITRLECRSWTTLPNSRASTKSMEVQPSRMETSLRFRRIRRCRKSSDLTERRGSKSGSSSTERQGGLTLQPSQNSLLREKVQASRLHSRRHILSMIRLHRVMHVLRSLCSASWRSSKCTRRRTGISSWFRMRTESGAGRRMRRAKTNIVSPTSQSLRLSRNSLVLDKLGGRVISPAQLIFFISTKSFLASTKSFPFTN